MQFITRLEFMRLHLVDEQAGYLVLILSGLQLSFQVTKSVVTCFHMYFRYAGW